MTFDIQLHRYGDLQLRQRYLALLIRVDTPAWSTWLCRSGALSLKFSNAADISLYRLGDIQLRRKCFCFAVCCRYSAQVDTALSARSAFAFVHDCCWYTTFAVDTPPWGTRLCHQVMHWPQYLMAVVTQLYRAGDIQLRRI